MQHMTALENELQKEKNEDFLKIILLMTLFDNIS